MKQALDPVEKLTSEHSLESFDCGNDALNEYLRTYALINQKLSIAQTYVAQVDGSVIGFYTLATASAQHEETPKKISRGLPRYPIPILLIARLAVDVRYQKKKIGKGLLKDALLRARKVADIVGIRAVLVHAKNEEVASWYRRFDFESSPLDETHLFLSVKDIKFCTS